MTTVNTIEQLFVEELKDVYSSETQIAKALPKLSEAASSADLKSAFEQQLRETEGQIQRLDKVFKLLGTNPNGKTCDGMKGILTEGNELLRGIRTGDIRDVALISAGQKVEQYEMAEYGTVRSYAQNLNRQEIAGLLQETLEEKKTANKKLTEISQKINGHVLHAA